MEIRKNKVQGVINKLRGLFNAKLVKPRSADNKRFKAILKMGAPLHLSEIRDVEFIWPVRFGLFYKNDFISALFDLAVYGIEGKQDEESAARRDELRGFLLNDIKILGDNYECAQRIFEDSKIALTFLKAYAFFYSRELILPYYLKSVIHKLSNAQSDGDLEFTSLCRALLDEINNEKEPIEALIKGLDNRGIYGKKLKKKTIAKIQQSESKYISLLKELSPSSPWYALLDSFHQCRYSFLPAF